MYFPTAKLKMKFLKQSLLQSPEEMSAYEKMIIADRLEDLATCLREQADSEEVAQGHNDSWIDRLTDRMERDW